MSSIDGKTTEIDGFLIGKNNIKKKEWEQDFHIKKGDIPVTKEMRFGKKILSISSKEEIDTKYDRVHFYSRDPRLYFHLRIETIDIKNDDSGLLDFVCPETITINIFLNDSDYDELIVPEFKNVFATNLEIVVFDEKAKNTFRDSNIFYENYPDWLKLKDVKLIFNIWPSNTYDYTIKNVDYKDSWAGDHYCMVCPYSSSDNYELRPRKPYYNSNHSILI